MPGRGINFWGEAFQVISLFYSKGYLGNAIAPTPYFEGRSWPKNIKSKKHTLEREYGERGKGQFYLILPTQCPKPYTLNPTPYTLHPTPSPMA
ncbi:MAG: hypothetical protein F6J93_03120 [Oscillatoria sp. SIO1A7]|nr:hypothetical protein [Oscillatoria sp. SIO1A7]